MEVNLQALQAGVVSAGVVLVGLAFSFGVAVVPHFGSAYQLLALPVGLGVSLYGIYGVVAALLPQSAADQLGLKLLGLHVVMGLLLRASIDPRMLSGWLALVPTLLILYMLADLYLRHRHGGAA
jgi:hypothetical protein